MTGPTLRFLCAGTKCPNERRLLMYCGRKNYELWLFVDFILYVPKILIRFKKWWSPSQEIFYLFKVITENKKISIQYQNPVIWVFGFDVKDNTKSWFYNPAMLQIKLIFRIRFHVPHCGHFRKVYECNWLKNLYISHKIVWW